MKKGLLLLVALCCFAAHACATEPMLTLGELKEQVPAYWQGSYESKAGRKAAFNAPILMPTADEMPILSVKLALPSKEKRDKYRELIDNEYPNWFSFWKGEYGWPIGSKRITERVYYHLWETEPQTALKDIAAKGQDLSLVDVATVVEAWAKELYGEEIGFIADSAKVCSPLFHDESGELFNCGSLTGKGNIDFEMIMTLRGIPILGVPRYNQGDSTRIDQILDGIGESANLHGFTDEDNFHLGFTIWREIERLEADVPLCSFEKIKRAVEVRMERGDISDVYELRLGYIVWLDPEVDYPKSSQWESLQEAKMMPFRVAPVWLVACRVGKSPDGVDYAEYERLEREADTKNPKRGSEEVFDYKKQWGYTTIMMNAQTGEVYDPWDESEDRCVAPEMIAW